MIGSIVNYDKHVNVHEINEETETIRGMNEWIKSMMLFRKNAKRKGKRM